ncbi:unnamed protein product [Rhizoctonia solani]|uniref:Ricin B lectin domain-containing protein n=1 Tax=Rhizoctonia solani TaxID=456999 RepID=A0A8H3CM82_9AGAM|nr:unnamed protein product [Rhizoctonia solani]
MAYERPPEPGTYYIKSVAAPENVIEVPSFNDERAVCSPQAVEPSSNQHWYVQRSGRGYKIKNVKHGVYLSSYSTKPKNATLIGTSPRHGPVDWYILRTHDGFVIQYGETEMAIDLYHALAEPHNVLYLWDTSPQAAHHRWKFERINDDVGGEVAETVDDRITVLTDQLRKKDVEIAKRDAELLAQKEQELRDTLQSRRGVPPKIIRDRLAEIRNKIEDLTYLVEACGDHLEAPNDTS